MEIIGHIINNEAHCFWCFAGWSHDIARAQRQGKSIRIIRKSDKVMDCECCGMPINSNDEK